MEKLINPSIIHVIVGIVFNHEGEVLIAKRPADKHLGGYWEFPGGKVEVGENTFVALQREFREEIGIVIIEAMQCLQTKHCYAEKWVLLDFWYITAYSGQARGLEGQEIRWVKIKDLQAYEFPEANHAIVRRLQESLKQSSTHSV